MRFRSLRVALAVAAAAALLTTSTSGYTAWQQAHAAAPDGLALESGPMEVHVTPAGGAPRRVDPQNGIRAVVGDTITVRLPVTVHMGGHAQSILTVDVPDAKGDPVLAGELAANPTPVDVTPTDGGPDLGAVPGRPTSRVVTAASDGHGYLVRWRTSTRPTRDGKTRSKENAWGGGAGSLQGAAVAARPLTVTLTPGTPGSVPAPSTAPGGAR